VTEITIDMPVAKLASLPRGEEMRDRILEMARAHIPDEEIAEILTNEGHRSASCTDKVLPITVSCIRRQAGIKVVRQRSRWRDKEGKLRIRQLAAVLDIPEKWLRVQIRQGCILLEKSNGAYLFEDTPATLDVVLELRKHKVDQIDLRSSQLQHRGH
jgi:DNA repair protein RadC